MKYTNKCFYNLQQLGNDDIKEIILPGLHSMQSPSGPLIGSPVSWSTLMMDIGYTDGRIRETKPMAPTVLSTFTKIQNTIFMLMIILNLK